MHAEQLYKGHSQKVLMFSSMVIQGAEKKKDVIS